MLRRGDSLFVMHYHSPSLSPGHTPYVRSAKDADRFVESIREVYRFFFEEVGGMPGYPPDLLDIAESRVAALSDMAFPADCLPRFYLTCPGEVRLIQSSDARSFLREPLNTVSTCHFRRKSELSWTSHATSGLPFMAQRIGFAMVALK